MENERELPLYESSLMSCVDEPIHLSIKTSSRQLFMEGYDLTLAAD